MLNGVAGDLIGPWYGALAALIAGIIRNTIGTGTIFLSFEEQKRVFYLFSRVTPPRVCGMKSPSTCKQGEGRICCRRSRGFYLGHE